MGQNSEASNSSDGAKDIKTMPASAFLIVNSQVFPLDRELINIGRKLDNHVVIHDPQVSRNHAQLRIMDGQFVILDLNSTGGTFVNGVRVTKSVLYSGDSITLSGVPLKFVQDAPKIMTESMDRTGELPGIDETPTQQLESYKTKNNLKKKKRPHAVVFLWRPLSGPGAAEQQPEPQAAAEREQADKDKNVLPETQGEQANQRIREQEQPGIALEENAVEANEDLVKVHDSDHQ
jgi:pSer/pThr/pTyr-binding forkhead associated (FHA) protein